MRGWIRRASVLGLLLIAACAPAESNPHHATFTGSTRPTFTASTLPAETFTDTEELSEFSSTTTDDGPTALCVDGTLSYAEHHQGACSWHGGVLVFYR